jgi:ribokinase
LRELGARDVVVKLGERGAYWAGPAGEGLSPGFTITPVDTTAAGDAFTASLAVSLASGAEMPQALKRANAAGALACLKLGAQPSMPTAAEVDDFLSRRG